jgi:hypothetical protein
MEPISKLELTSIHSLSFKLHSSVGRERERQRQNCRKDSRRKKEKCKVPSLQNLFIYTLYLHTVTDCTYKNEKEDMATIIKIPCYCFCSFVVTVIFVNLLCSSYFHFQKKLDNIMQECINAHITL